MTHPHSNIHSRLEKAEQLKFLGEHEEALKILEQLLLEDPGSTAVLEEIADNELSMERYDRAEAAARQAVALKPGSERGHYTLGFVASHREEWERAVNELSQANTLHPHNPEVLRCLGWVLFHQGQRLQGIVTLERALNLDGDNTMTLCDLGVAYLEVKNFSKAKALFHRVLALDPTDERAQECVEVVERLERELQKGVKG